MSLFFLLIVMVRPCLEKNIEKDPQYTCFKPAWVPKSKLEKVEIAAEEFEAYRLSHLEWLSNIEGAEKMNTSAPTFNRLVKSASLKIADALVNGKRMRLYKQDWTHNCK